MAPAQRRVRFTVALLIYGFVSIISLAGAVPVRRHAPTHLTRRNPVSVYDEAIASLSLVRPKGRHTLRRDTPLQIFPTVRLGLNANPGKKSSPKETLPTPTARVSSSPNARPDVTKPAASRPVSAKTLETSAPTIVGKNASAGAPSLNVSKSSNMHLTHALQSTSHAATSEPLDANKTSPAPQNKRTNSGDASIPPAVVLAKTPSPVAKKHKSNTEKPIRWPDDTHNPEDGTEDTAEDAAKDDTEASEAKVDSDDESLDDDEFLGTDPMKIFSREGSKRMRLMEGGVIELIEWLFVFILVAPGTFPAMGCFLYTCTSVARRRISPSTASEAPSEGTHVHVNNNRAVRVPVLAELQHRASANVENWGISGRGRHRSTADEREDS